MEGGGLNLGSLKYIYPRLSSICSGSSSNSVISESKTKYFICKKLFLSDFFDFEAKYSGLSDEITPARISDLETEKVQKITKEVYQKMGLKGIVRIDYIIMKGIPYLIEINTIPGLSTKSIIPKQAKQAGYSLSELFELTIENTINK